MPRYEYRNLFPLPLADKAFRHWIDDLAERFVIPGVDHRSMIVRDALHEIYLGRPYGDPGEHAGLAERAFVHSFDPRNVTLESEYYGDIDIAKYAERKPLIWFWMMFDRSPLGLNHWLGFRLRAMLAKYIFRHIGKNVKIFHGVEVSFGYNLAENMVELLGAEQPFYGFQFVGTPDGEATALSIEETARRNLESLRSVQPHGPYYLAGYCWGCTAVLEMAQQLRASGEQVAELILVDPLHPDYYGYFLENPVLLIGLLAQVINPGRDVDLMSIETLQEMTFEEQISRAYEHLQRMNLVLPELSEDGFRAMVLHFRNNLQSLVDYKGQRYDGSATLFVVEDYPQEWLAYWQRLASSLRPVELSGTHYSIWVDPAHAEPFSAHLQNLLEVSDREPCAALAN